MTHRCALLLAVALVAPGCSGTPSAGTPPPPDVSEGLKELAEVYKYRAAQKLPPPAKADDLLEHDAALGNARPAIQDGAIVVVWRAGYSPGSTDVLVYEKDAPAGGGKVLLRNGTIKEMTAAEFRAARK